MSKPDKFYYNLSCSNTGTRIIPASTTITNQAVVLDNPSNYTVSCVRFDVFTSFPLFFPIIPDPIAFPLQTDMSITLEYSGVFYQEFVDVTPDEVKLGIFSIGPLLSEFNAASQAAFALLKAAFPAAPMQMAPYFAFNPDTQIVSMYVDVNWLESPAAGIIYLNQTSQTVLNLPSRFFKNIPNLFGADYQVRVLDYAKTLPLVGTRFGYPAFLFSLNFAILQVEQEFPQTNNFVGLDRLIISSSRIPSVPELIPLSSPGQSDTTQNASLPVLTDLSIAGLDHNFLYTLYLPTAEYRRISMISNSPLQDMDFTLYYTTTDGRINPVLLYPQGYFTAKLLFERVR